jgi:hypothetical protein
MGSDLSWMLWKQMHGQINSWAIRFCFHQYLLNKYSVHPVISKVQNIGIGDINATNTLKKTTRYETNVDMSLNIKFRFIETPFIERSIIRQFIKPYSLVERLINKFYGGEK